MKSLNSYIADNLCSFAVAHNLLRNFFKSFSMDEIPVSVRKKAVRDYEEISNNAKICSEDYLNEPETNLVETLKEDIISTQSAITILKDKYGMSDYQFKAVHPYKVQIVSVDKIPNYLASSNSILFPAINKNVDIIKNEMDSIGYYLVCETSYYDKASECEWVLLMFDPKRQESVTSRIRNTCSVLYHFSPASNHASIVEDGFEPKNDKQVYNFNNDRVYLTTTDPTHPDFKKMLMNVYSNRKLKDKSFAGDFMIYMIKTSKIPDSVDFFYDPHGSNCIYAIKNIPYSAVINDELIRL